MELSAHPAQIILIEAAVYEEQDYHEAQARRDLAEQRSPRDVVRTAPGTNRLGLRVVLTAVLGDGRRIIAENSMGIGGAPGMRLSEVKEQIDRLLGRDSNLRRPPRLAWDPLISALQGMGVAVSEAELIATPLEMRLGPSASEVLALD